MTTPTAAGAGARARHINAPTARAKAHLWQMDCVSGMRRMRAESVHFIITDPPYFLDGFTDRWNDTALRQKTRPGVVSSLPRGMKFDRTQADDLLQFMGKVAAEMYHILKPGGFAAVFAQPRLAFATGMALHTANFDVRDQLAWQKNGQPKAFSLDHFISKMKMPNTDKLQLRKSVRGKKTAQLKPQFENIILAQKPPQGTLLANWHQHKIGLLSPEQSLLDGFPGNLIDIRGPKENRRYKHFTVKPVKLIQHLLQLFTLQGQVVCDPFTGTGSAALACALARRRFIGFEIDPAHVKTAKKRLNHENQAILIGKNHDKPIEKQ